MSQPKCPSTGDAKLTRVDCTMEILCKVQNNEVDFYVSIWKDARIYYYMKKAL